MTRGAAEQGGESAWRWAGACTALALAAVLAWAGRAPGRVADGAPREAAPALPAALAAPEPDPMLPDRPAEDRPRASAATARAVAPPAPAPAASESKWARVHALVASGKPADALAAYRILSLCAVVQSLQQAEDHSGDPAQRDDRGKLGDKCGDLSPGQLGERVRLLEAAADAHVPGAVAALMNQGPDGQPVADVWDDPAYADWRRRTLERVEAEADRGDAVALQLMVARHDHGQRPLAAEDSAAALKYYTAYADVQLATDPAFASPTRRESLALLVRRLSGLYGESLTPDQFDAAVAAGSTRPALTTPGAPALSTVP